MTSLSHRPCDRVSARGASALLDSVKFLGPGAVADEQMLDPGVHLLLVHSTTRFKQKGGDGIPGEVAKLRERSHVNA